MIKVVNTPGGRRYLHCTQTSRGKKCRFVSARKAASLRGSKKGRKTTRRRRSTRRRKRH